MVPKTPEIAGKDFCKPEQCRRNSGGAWVHAPPPETPKYRGSGMSSSPLSSYAGGDLQEQPKRNKAVDFSSLFSFSDLVHSVFWICFTADRSPSVIFFFSSVPCAARQGGTDEGVVSLLEAVSGVCWPVGCCCRWRLFGG
jgi:hypothetical protein